MDVDGEHPPSEGSRRRKRDGGMGVGWGMRERGGMAVIVGAKSDAQRFWTRETRDGRDDLLTDDSSFGGLRIPFLGLFFSKENESPNGSRASASFRSRLPGSSMNSFDSDPSVARSKGSAWVTPLFPARAHRRWRPLRGGSRKLVLRLAPRAPRAAPLILERANRGRQRPCAASRSSRRREPTVGSRRLARGGDSGISRAVGQPWTLARRQRQSCPRGAQKGGRSAAGYGSTPPGSRRVRRYRLRFHRRSRRGFPPACAPRALEPLRRGNRHWGVGLRLGPRSELWSPASTRSPPPSRRYDARRILPARYPPPRAPTPAPPRARPPVPSPDPTDRSLGDPLDASFLFAPATSDSVSPNPTPVPPRPGENRADLGLARAPLSSPSERRLRLHRRRRVRSIVAEIPRPPRFPRVKRRA